LERLQRQVNSLQQRNQELQETLGNCIVCLGFALKILKQEDTSPQTLQATIATSERLIKNLEASLE
jgi:cell division septum initiation protein DivIVA